MRKTFILSLLLLLGGLQAVQAQKIVLKFVNGEIVKYNISELESIWFEDTVTIIDDTHEYVDLGLPSGTLWATCNVGATAPEEYGDYFAWGETKPKSEFTWENYKYSGGTNHLLTKYCNNDFFGYNGFTDDLTELLPEDDAATVNWGENWQTPTVEQVKELVNNVNTSTKWTTVNGVIGRLVTSKKNNKSIFFPAAGCYTETLEDVGFGCGFWSRTLAEYPDEANAGYLLIEDVGWADDIDRNWGINVRPVRKQ